MKPATHAPFYACLYAGLCDKARENGYALAIHGSVITDLDLVAVPWTAKAVSAEHLVDVLREHAQAVDYRGMLARDCTWATPAQVDEMVQKEAERIGEPKLPNGATLKPHGRMAWNLYLEHGCKIDLSVMPRRHVDAQDAAP